MKVGRQESAKEGDAVHLCTLSGAAMHETMDRAIFRQAAPAVARQLLGLYLVHETPAGRAVGRIDLMRSRREVQQERALCSGPGKLTQAMGITMELYGIDLLDPDSSLRLEVPEADQALTVVQTSRIGISRAKELERRYYIEGNPYLSRK